MVKSGGLIHATVACLSRTIAKLPSGWPPRRPLSRSLGRTIACRGSFLLSDRVMIDRMPQYAHDTIDDVHLALRGLGHRMEVEVEPGIPLAAHTVADLRARATWPPGLQLIVPDEPDRPASVVRVERRK